MTGTDLIAAILLAGILIAVVVYLLYWLYRRSSKDVAFVRTGFGGEKVVISGGALVLPIVHNITQVGMSTLRLEVRRGGPQALITRNRMRVDVVAEFYVRVKPDKDSVSLAAQALGSRTMDAERLKDLVQGRFVDALGAVAAQMTMDEIQEQRGKYVKEVRQLVEGTFAATGLELEAVSLTGLDQTDIEMFNPSNAFDAEGLAQLTEQIEKRKKVRNDIEQDTMVEIRAKNLEAERQALEIDRESHYARLLQEREIAQRRAEEHAEIAKNRALRDREAQEAEIEAQEAVERARIQRDKAVEAERSLRETDLTEEIEGRRKHRNAVEREAEISIRAKNLETELRILDIEKELEFERLNQQEEVATRRARQAAEVARRKAESERDSETAEIEAHEAVDKARLGQELAVELERIRKEREIEQQEILRRKLLELEDIDRAIAKIQKEQARVEAHIEIETTRARAVEAEEIVVTTREKVASERRKLIELIEAAKASESEALQLTTISKAQTEAAEQRALAEEFAAKAARIRHEVEALGRRQMNEAENALSDDSRDHALRMKLIEHLEAIIRESVKPMESINDIKILQVEGLPGLSGVHPAGGGGSGGGLPSDLEGPGGEGRGSLADNIVSSALRYRAQAPFVDSLLKEIGMSPGEISKLGKLLQESDRPGDDEA